MALNLTGLSDLASFLPLAQADAPAAAEQPGEGAETAASPPAAAGESQGHDPGQAIGDALSGDTDALVAMVTDYALPAALVILVLIVAYFLGKGLGRALGAGVSKRIDETLGKFLAKLVFYAVMIFAVLGVLGKFGISVASFAAVLAAAGFAIGLAFQGSLSNFAAGIMLLVFRPFKVGHVVTIAGVTAKVDEIELFTSSLDTFDNRRFIVPNSEIFGATIENISYHPERRVDVNVGVEYAADLDKTREVLGQACESLSDKMIQGENRGYQIYLLELGDSSVNWVVRFWTRAEDYWPVREQLTRAVKMHLDEAGLGIPFPQMDVHLDHAATQTTEAGSA